MLERYEAKVSRTVLRRGRASNRSFLFGTEGDMRFVHPSAFHETINLHGIRILGAELIRQKVRISANSYPECKLV